VSRYDVVPYTVEFVNPQTWEVLWAVTLLEPGPSHMPRGSELNCPVVLMRVTFADGTTASHVLVNGTMTAPVTGT
jgi:hypothetical protein